MSHRVKILIADDDETALMLLQRGVEDPAYRIATAASGKEVLQKLSEEPFDIVLSDIGMPAPNGIELTRIIKEKHPATDVLILTAFTTMDTVKEVLEAGAYDYLTKPFDLRLVKAALKRCVEKRAYQGGVVPLLEKVRQMADRVAELKAGVEAAEMGAEHETCKDFARRLIAEVQARLTAVDPSLKR